MRVANVGGEEFKEPIERPRAGGGDKGEGAARDGKSGEEAGTSSIFPARQNSHLLKK